MQREDVLREVIKKLNSENNCDVAEVTVRIGTEIIQFQTKNLIICEDNGTLMRCSVDFANQATDVLLMAQLAQIEEKLARDMEE